MNLDIIKEKCEIALNSLKTSLSNKIAISVDFKDSLEINAYVQKIDEGNYKITFYTGTFESIRNIVVHYFSHITLRDIKNYKFSYKDNYFRMFEGHDALNEFYNHVALLILDSIMLHEYSHIMLGHLEEKDLKMYENGENMVGGVKTQSVEMKADLLSIYYCVSVNFFANPFLRQIKNFDFDNELCVSELKKILNTLIIAYYIQFAVFVEKNYYSQLNELENCDLDKTHHPHPYVRISYSYDKIIDSLSHLLSEFYNIDYDNVFYRISAIACLEQNEFDKFTTSNNTSPIINIALNKKIKRQCEKIKSNKLYKRFHFKEYDGF